MIIFLSIILIIPCHNHSRDHVWSFSASAVLLLFLYHHHSIILLLSWSLLLFISCYFAHPPPQKKKNTIDTKNDPLENIYIYISGFNMPAIFWGYPPIPGPQTRNLPLGSIAPGWAESVMPNGKCQSSLGSPWVTFLGSSNYYGFDGSEIR